MTTRTETTTKPEAHDPYEDVSPDVGEIVRSFEKVAVGHVSFARAARMAEAVLAMEAPGDVEAITEAIRVADGARTAVGRYRELAVLIHQHQAGLTPPPSTNEVLAGAKPPKVDPIVKIPVE